GGDLDEGELADPLRLHLQQTFHRAQPLLDPLRVVEAVDPDSDRVVRRQTVTRPHLPAALLDRRADQGGRGGPLDRNRVALDRGQLAAVGDSEHLPVDPGFQHTVDGVDEVVAVKLRVESEDARAQETVDRLLEARVDREMFTVSYRGKLTAVKRYPI